MKMIGLPFLQGGAPEEDKEKINWWVEGKGSLIAQEETSREVERHEMEGNRSEDRVWL